MPSATSPSEASGRVDRVLVAEPRGFCAGVEMAIKALTWLVRAFDEPVYCYHEIVHNKLVGERVEALGTPRGAWVSTFHAMGARILRREIEVLDQGWTRDLTIYDTHDKNQLIKGVTKDLGYDVQRFRPAMVSGWISNEKMAHAEGGELEAEGDNDGTMAGDDDFPRDANENNDLDGDGIGDNTDNDDDGDGWLDVTEMICLNAGGYGDPINADVMPHDNESTESAQGGPDGLCNAIDPDDDGDGFPDPLDEDNIVCNENLCEDAFKWDHTEWHDADADGSGDNGVALELMDDIRAEPGPFAMRSEEHTSELQSQ